MPRLLGVVLPFLALILGAPAPAVASCAQDSGPGGSDIVFVGTAQEERRGFTRLAVDEVWLGPDLAPATHATRSPVGSTAPIRRPARSSWSRSLSP